MRKITSLADYAKLLRELIDAPENDLRELAGEHPPYGETGRVCVEYMYSFSAQHPDALPQFAASVLKSRQDPTYKIELINTGD